MLAALALLAIGLAAIYRAEELAGGTGRTLRRQLVWGILSIAAMLAVTTVSYVRMRRWSYWLFAASLPLLASVYLFSPVNGAHRWIRIGSVSLQPSEFAKLAFILALGRYLMYRRNYRQLRGLLGPFALALVPMVLILKEPDLGTSLVFLPVLFIMLFAAGARLRHLALVAGLGLAVLPVLWTQMNLQQRSRVQALFSQTDAGAVPRGAGYQLHQSKQVLALGGVLGSYWHGVVVDDPRAYHLPEARTDFIFSVVGERWGLVGCTVVLVLFLFLLARGLKIASATQEPFGRLVAVGIVAQFAVQVIVNSSMTVGLMPITGMTLPLLSYGGSSLLASFVGLGLLMNIGMRPGFELTGEPFRFRD